MFKKLSLAARVLQGKPVAYRVTVRDGNLMLAENMSVVECTIAK